jgi:hypothetical protein
MVTVTTALIEPIFTATSAISTTTTQVDADHFSSNGRVSALEIPTQIQTPVQAAAVAVTVVAMEAVLAPWARSQACPANR